MNSKPNLKKRSLKKLTQKQTMFISGGTGTAKPTDPKSIKIPLSNPTTSIIYELE
ncbi:hypothetical protein [Pseudoalteromonas luteoviolacea]|uniref:Uncharacterized protein n=1 Tax=Pseudoalteromonas luteoviolacea S4054 TaxID=1129367 RepID=A0A0F6AC75_9GAMM|nr:hypothetical protein [Pseudoalteromonas luteoviolacea]KKE83790.1 hypothetical protein N479_12420 [Pseudoalteromonas luteoviolacea S4054]KZN73927.1 hypothetical protein N481_10835 [Pseudoalteromonas luteoviolacea S4047-1]